MELQQKSVSVRIYRWLCEDARANGIDLAPLYDTLGIGPAELADDTRRIAGDRHVAAMQLTSAWPLSWHRPPPQVVPWLVPFPELAGVTCNAATLRDALHGYLHYRELIGNVDWVFAHENGDAIALEYVNEGDGRHAGSAFANLAILAALARLYDPHVCVDDAAFAGRAFAPAAALRDMLGAPMSFDAAHNRIVLRSAHFDTPFERYNAPLAGIQRHAADAARERVRVRSTFGSSVEQCVRDWLRTADEADVPTDTLMQHVCTRFAMSRWTLRRRLHREAVGFHALVAQARLGEARDLLLNTQLPIGEIGVRVGFRSTSAFTRFFTRELGAAPSRFRDGHGDRWR
ncbi:helix-turn-helix transcriptional regulator [Burkholderia cepacia]|uniref:helix-turn-helix transcriptional regulator n=1 Tax=Burkholderia cepacia TaxID=292 RepID=UPI0015764CF7|nr:helix-turn-helix transcriptional regulator [Burkholderia cepacia]MBJ9754251.1 helix-turn-helix transcriptional regulator [Burkholderia cepacia]NTX21889.1 helix-turn-helix transcriptional regulator [Burkholderia cepacia]